VEEREAQIMSQVLWQLNAEIPEGMVDEKEYFVEARRRTQAILAKDGSRSNAKPILTCRRTRELGQRLPNLVEGAHPPACVDGGRTLRHGGRESRRAGRGVVRLVPQTRPRVGAILRGR
jgi:hypothetical protein